MRVRFPPKSLMQIWYRGSTRPCQGRGTGSIPVICLMHHSPSWPWRLPSKQKQGRFESDMVLYTKMPGWRNWQRYCLSKRVTRGGPNSHEVRNRSARSGIGKMPYHKKVQGSSPWSGFEVGGNGSHLIFRTSGPQ